MSESAAHELPREVVGRTAELALLRELLDAGHAGHPSAVIIRGEAGIGKTRLVNEFLVEAAARADDTKPVVVATGQCVDMGPFGAPFTPIRRMLADLRAGVGEDEFARALGGPAAAAILAPLVPALAEGEAAPSDSAPYLADTIESLLERLSGTDLSDLKRRIEAAAQTTGTFVDFIVVGNRATSVLISTGTPIVFSVETVQYDDRDTGDDDEPFGGLFDF